MNYGGSLTKQLFNIVKNEYKNRKNNEAFVEKYLLSFGCAGLDGECSNLFRKNEILNLQKYFEYLANVFDMKSIPIFEYNEYGNLFGERIKIENNLQEIKKLLIKENLFSYAFVTMRTLSVTYRKGENNE